MPNIMMKCPRDFTLRSTSGHTVVFEAGKPTPVPEALYADALARNIVPVADYLDTDAAATGNTRVQLTGPLRDALIFTAIDALVKRNQPEDFDGGGQPKPASVKEYCGIAISAQERTKYWANYREFTGNNIELPTHPNVELVMELQSLTNRKQLLEFAKDNDIELAKIEGKTPQELKSILLGMMTHIRQAPLQSANTTTLAED